MNVHARLLTGIMVLVAASALDAGAADYPPEDYLTHTIPIMYIDTEGGVPITSKTEYVNATCRIDAAGLEGYQSLGSQDAPLPLQIKGRGNSSWSKPKKPYRLKFESKVSPLGMKKNRHFVLLAEWGEGHGRTNWETGFFVSRLMGLPWTPAHEPVELVLNGEYAGLYFLSEKIRVGSGRVNIEEQSDGETDPGLVTGGWLCEIDNYSATPQVAIRDRTTGKWLRTTIHSPEELSAVQRSYITDLVKRTDDAIYCKDKTSTAWEELIDLDALVRYYLVCEVVNQIEGFSGSCYWWKERGEDTKINFGPVWDFDTSNAMWKTFRFCYENNPTDPIQDRNHWIMEIARYPRFQQRVRELWAEYCDSSAALVEPHALAFVQRVHAAAESDILRWSSYYTDAGWLNTDYRARKYLDRLQARHEWLVEQWSRPVAVIGDVNADGEVTSADAATLREYLLTRPVDTVSVENADAYCDDTLDVCDLVGVVRLVFRQSHPEAELPSAQSVPYGVDDHAVSTTSFMTIDAPAGAWYPHEEHKLGIRAVTESGFTAFSVDISTPPSFSVTGVRVDGIDDARYQVHMERLDSVTMRIIGCSNSLRKFDSSVGRSPFLLLTLRADGTASSACDSICVSNLLLADTDMSPTRLEDLSIPVNVYPRGDVDCNGIVDVSDVNAVINIILKLKSVSDYLGNGDMDGNGIIDVADVNAIINIILRLGRLENQPVKTYLK